MLRIPLLLGTCLCAFMARLSHAYTMTVYSNKLCTPPALNVTTIKQDECVKLAGGPRPRSGIYTCKQERLLSEVWIGSEDCMDTNKGYVTPVSSEVSVGGSSATESDPDCSPAPWLENGDRYVEIDCAAGSMLRPTSVVLFAAAGLAAAFR